jgi:hypothetical protein
MNWIRGPWWDSFWLLSAIPFGLLFMLCGWGGIRPELIVLWTVLITQTGHLLAPICLAWFHAGFRHLMRDQATKYIILPLFLLATATGVAYASSFYLPDIRFNPTSFSISAGPTTLAEFKNPFMTMVVIYTLWNAYHFGKQAFGVMSIYRNKVNQRRADQYGPGQRKVDLIYCCGVVWATMIIPFVPHLAKAMHDLSGWPVHPHPFLEYIKSLYIILALAAIAGMLWRERLTKVCVPRVALILIDGLGMIMAFWSGLWGFALIALNHWLVAIGLASHVWANHNKGSSTLIAIGLMAAGMLVFCLLFVDLGALSTVGISTAALHFTVTTVGLRLGLGFVHFLYDRWIYKFSDKRVRVAIGKDLIESPAI